MSLPKISANDFIDPAGLHNEKSMWDLYKLSFKFPRSKFNLGILTITFLSLLLYCYYIDPPINEIAHSIRTTLAFGVSLAPAVIGFLVAGFTIFVTVTKVELFNFMAIRRYKQTNESYLKYNMSAFMLAFIHYCAFIFICAVLTIFAQPNGPIIIAIKFLLGIFWAGSEMEYYKHILKVFFSFFGAWSIYLVMLLKTFVFNIYQVLCTTVRWSLESGEMKKMLARDYPERRI